MEVLGSSFLQELLCVSFLSDSCCSSFLFLLFVMSCSLQEKVIYKMSCLWDAKRRERMSGHSMPINCQLFSFYYLSFQSYFPLIFIAHLLFQCMHYCKPSSSSLLVIQPLTCLVNKLYPLFVDFDSVSDVLWPSYSFSFPNMTIILLLSPITLWLTILSPHAIFIRCLQSLFRQ